MTARNSDNEQNNNKKNFTLLPPPLFSLIQSAIHAP